MVCCVNLSFQHRKIAPRGLCFSQPRVNSQTYPQTRGWNLARLTLFARTFWLESENLGKSASLIHAIPALCPPIHIPNPVLDTVIEVIHTP